MDRKVVEALSLFPAPSLYLPLSLCLLLSVSFSLSPSLCLLSVFPLSSLCLLLSVSLSLSLYLFICLSVYLSICLSVYLSACLSVCLPACLSVCLSACYHTASADEKTRWCCLLFMCRTTSSSVLHGVSDSFGIRLAWQQWYRSSRRATTSKGRYEKPTLCRTSLHTDW